MAHVVDYATPQPRKRHRSVWLIVLLGVTIPALLTAAATLRQRQAAMRDYQRALQARQRAALMAAQAARQQQVVSQAQTRPAEPEIQPKADQ